MTKTYLIGAAILFTLVFGIFSNTNTTKTAIAQQQQQLTGTVEGMGASEIPLRVCNTVYPKDFLTVKFDASFLLSSDRKTGKVTSGTGILKTTDSGAFAYLSITGGDITTSVEPKLYTLKGSATFQSPSYCNPPSTVAFSIARPDGTQLKCGNIDLITFNSIPLTGSVSGSVSCRTTILPIFTASPKGGTFNTSPILVTLTSNEPSTTIYYTRDGSTPNLSSTKYTGPITISSTTTLKFFGVDTAGNKETVQTEKYTIHKTTTTTPLTVTDTTPPTVIPTLTPNVPDGQNGFYVQPVTVTWSGDDGPTGSGISSCDSPTSYSGPDGSSILLEGHCTDKAGNVGKGSITIKYDSNPPAINMPTSIIKESTSPQGSPVTYAVSATDAVDRYISADCFPASGSIFKFGTTTVTCKATDSAGNVAIKTFTVTVQRHITTLPQNTKTFENQRTAISDGTRTTTNVPSPSLPSPPHLREQQPQQPPVNQPRIPVQPDKSGQTAISPPQPHPPPPLQP